MNIANLRAANETAFLLAEQGWNDSTQLQLLYDFIHLKQMYPELLEYLKRRAEPN